MAVGSLSYLFVSYAGPCWRAVSAGREAMVLDGSHGAGRYNRPGERTLYMSSSPDGVAAAMARYGDAPRTVVALAVEAAGLLDLRDEAACAAFGVEAALGKADWVAALERGKTPPSWRIADQARAIGAIGLIDGSRRLPEAWHLVLFRWNIEGGADVRVVTGSTAPRQSRVVGPS